MNDLAKVVSDMIPKSLDAVIRENRHLVDLHLATDAELASIAGDLLPAPAKDDISDYRLVSILGANPATLSAHPLSIHVLGTCSAGESWITSSVTTLDLTSGYALTKNGSLYKLREAPLLNEPSCLDLMCLCAFMNNWGLGKFLGIPDFHY